MRRSISSDLSRHGVVDRRSGQYLCFPDVAKDQNGALLAVYREADQHVASRSRLLCSYSWDNGKTWDSPKELNGQAGHCPRISQTESGELIAIDDLSASIYRFGPGETFRRIPIQTHARHELADAPLTIPDRMICYPDGRLGTISQVRLGTYGLSHYPTTNQAQWANLYYESSDGGENWIPLSVAGMEKDLSLCETSACRLPDGRLLALMRENTGVYEPMYAAFSNDCGKSWGPVKPTPLIGHRPCVGVTSDGRLLITYRGVGPERATNAWLGGVEELCEFAVHGSDGRLKLSSEGLQTEGNGERPLFFALRPLSNPMTASAQFTVRVRVLQGGGACGVQFGGIWWALTAKGIRPESGEEIALNPGSLLRFYYQQGKTTLFADNRLCVSIPVTPGKNTRIITFGEHREFSSTEGGALWQEMSLEIEEPSYLRKYHWKWSPKDGLPDDYTRRRVLELKNAAGLWGGDYGYSGWTEYAPGEFCCVYHHADPDAERAKGSYVLATRFSNDDFTKKV